MMVSVNADDLALVVELACLTEHRDNEEQKALLAVAERCDKKRNAKVGSLERQVDATRRLEEADERRIKPSWERKKKR